MAPLYNTFADIDRAVEAMLDIVASGRHLEEPVRPTVT